MALSIRSDLICGMCAQENSRHASNGDGFGILVGFYGCKRLVDWLQKWQGDVAMSECDQRLRSGLDL